MKLNEYLSKCLILIGVFYFSSCANVEEEFVKEDTGVEANSHAIPIDKALSNLYSFMQTAESRSIFAHSKVVNVLSIGYPNAVTRGIGNVQVKGLMHVANFDGNGGYALLAADDRIKDKVIAIVDSGNVTASDVAAVNELLVHKEEYTDANYPTTGDAFIKVKEYPDETFLNPNTYVIKQGMEDESLLGNFSDGEDRIVTRSWGTKPSRRGLFMVERCADIVEMELENGKLAIETTVARSPWKVEKKVDNLLSRYREWYQGEPYNDLFPRRRRFLFFGQQHKAPVGCFPLAIAKILTFFRCPQYFNFNGFVIDWNTLDEVTTIGAHNQAKHLFKGVAELCDAYYFYAGTFTVPAKGASVLTKLGFHDVQRSDYNFDMVVNMLDRNCPVIIYGMPGFKVWKSHAWIIDGYKELTQTEESQTFYYGKLHSTSKDVHISQMVHCDFGWGGMSNGFYVTGVFAPFDSITGERKEQYNRHLRIVTYKRQ